jgi:polysaccharide export outer membrane protein
MMIRAIFLVATAISVALASSPALQAQGSATGSGQNPAELPSPALQISAGDLIQVLVFDTPELSGNFRVGQNGMVRLPLGGEVMVAGLSPQAAANAIEAQLQAKYILLNPHVEVMIAEFATTGVTVLGEIKTPGNYPLLGSHTLPDIIAAAGDLTTTAGDDLTVIHVSDPEHPIRVAGIHSENFARNMTMLLPGDRIIVSKAGVVYVLGDVGRPGGFVIDPKGGLNVLQALSLAQGFTKTAAQRRSVIIRKGDNSVLHIDSDVQKILDGKERDSELRDGDILYVPSSLTKTFTYRGIEAAIELGTGLVIYRGP